MAHVQREADGRRRLVPVLTVVSVASAATVGSFAIAASANAGQGGAIAVTQAAIDNYLAHQPRSSTKLLGVGESASPDFGIGKLTIAVEPQAGTFPAAMTPDFNGLALDVTDVTTGAYVQCIAQGTGTASCALPAPVTDVLTVSTDPGATLPPGFLAPAPLSLSIADCDPGSETPTICPADTTLDVPGTWRPVGLHVVNSVTGADVPGAKFGLCSPTDTTPTALACPGTSTVLESATTGADGRLMFPDVYQGSPDYWVVPESVPAGYTATAPEELAVPEITDASDAGTPYVDQVALQPSAPVLGRDAASVAEDRSTRIHVLSNDSTVGGVLALTKVGTPSHGHAIANADGTVTYRPAVGYVGHDSFSYTARNTLGGLATGTVKLTVTDVPPVARPVHLSVLSGRSVSFDIADYVTTVAGNTLTKTHVTQPAHGSAVDPLRRITYTPDAGFVGRDRFSVTVSDGKGGRVAVPVTVTVAAAPVEAAPVEAAPTTLAFTGAFVDDEAALGVALLGIGIMLMVGAGRPWRRRA